MKVYMNPHLDEKDLEFSKVIYSDKPFNDYIECPAWLLEGLNCEHLYTQNNIKFYGFL